MSVILLLNKKLLYEAPVSGDETARSVVKARGHLDKAKERLGKLGIHGNDLPSLANVNTIEQLKIEPFKLSFLIQVKDNQEELTEPKPKRVDCLARVINEKPLTLECKSESDGKLFTLEFIKDEELNTRLPGTKKSIRAIEAEDSRNEKQRKFYTILMDVLGENGNENDDENDDKNDDENDDGGEIGNKGKNTQKNKAELFNDLGSFFKFVYNNRKGMRNESKPNTFDGFVDSVSKSLLVLENEENKESDKLAKIYIKSITLGYKATAKRNADVDNYEQTVSKNSGTWDGTVIGLPSKPEEALNASVTLQLVDESKLNDQEKVGYAEIYRYLNNNNYSGNVRIRRSQKKEDQDTTFILIMDGDKALVGKTLRRGINLKDNMKNNEIMISPKASGNENLTRPTKAYIQVVTR